MCGFSKDEYYNYDDKKTSTLANKKPNWFEFNPKFAFMKNKVLDILYDSFYDNGSVNFVVKQDAKKDKRIKNLLEYSYYKGERFGNI